MTLDPAGRCRDNPLGQPYRCIDGKHRINRLVAAGASHVGAYVLSLEDVAPYVVALPLCALPPTAFLSGVGEEEAVSMSSAAGVALHLRQLGLMI